MSLDRSPSRVDFTFYEQPSTIHSFESLCEPLRTALDSEGADTSFTAPELAYFIAHFQQFQNNVLSPSDAFSARKNGSSISPRLPSSFFSLEHLNAESPLYHILFAAYQFRSENDIADWQFNASEERGTNIDMLKYVIRQLKDLGLLKKKKIAFASNVPAADKPELQKKIAELEAEYVVNATTATHIIYSQPSGIQDNEYKVVSDRDGRTLVHWVGYPDSYDEWVDDIHQLQGVASTSSKAQQDEHQAHHVSVDWLNSSYTYNEWANEQEHQVENAEPIESTNKRPIADAEQTHEGALKKSRTDEPDVGTDGQIKLEETNLGDDLEIEEEARKYLVQQQYEVLLPSYAAWHDLASIHEIERKSLPEFFNSRNKTKTPAVYKEYRDFMINTYRLNPLEYLTVTACRRNLAGDVCAIIRVHAFLEQWGLINYQVDPDARPSNVGAPLSGHFRPSAELPRALQSHQTATPNAPQGKPAGTVTSSMESTARKALDTNLELRKNVFAHAKSNDHLNGTAKEEADDLNECTSCGKTCEGVTYQSSKPPHVHLCESCYVDGKFPAKLFSGDFIRKTKVEAKEKEETVWTDQESLLLLEGLEMYSSDWSAVSQHVGTRTRDECILHFLHLPLEDPYSMTTMSELGMLQYKLSKESQGENPIMSVVAFLASTVDPDVAAAAARTTLKELGMEGKLGTAVKKEKTDSEMDVDKTKGDEADTADDDKATTTMTLPNLEEEKRISKLTCDFIGKQVEKFELRLAQFQDLEAAVEEEKRHVERERHQLYQERANMKKIQYQVQAEITKRQPPPPPPPQALPNGMSPAQLQQLSMQQQQQQPPNPGQLAHAQQQQFMRAQQYRDMMMHQQQQGASMPQYHQSHGYNQMRMQ
ncbi:hypothetical protein BC943DRAFT_306538 [Umbelopsis sp. AD052]|nr:hypothetical protein BC943DRAFT_306538 [Umbelopsis sp. AD052]